MWKDLPVPLTASFYLFNVSNADDVQNHGAKPYLTQMGPFSFQEFHHKFNISWNNENGTVTYKQVKKWVHVSGDLDQKVTVINIPFASVGAIVGRMSQIEQKLIQIGLSMLKNEKLFVTKTAREILFDGYKDPLLDAAEVLEKFNIHLEGITSKFGFFFGRNNTWYV